MMTGDERVSRTLTFVAIKEWPFSQYGGLEAMIIQREAGRIVKCLQKSDQVWIH